MDGADTAMVEGVKFLICDICERARGPREGHPKVSGVLPQQVNHTVGGDSFLICDLHVRPEAAHDHPFRGLLDGPAAGRC
jgi:hypothetical protein